MVDECVYKFNPIIFAAIFIAFVFYTGIFSINNYEGTSLANENISLESNEKTVINEKYICTSFLKISILYYYSYIDLCLLIHLIIWMVMM